MDENSTNPLARNGGLRRATSRLSAPAKTRQHLIVGRDSSRIDLSETGVDEESMGLFFLEERSGKRVPGGNCNPHSNSKVVS